MRVRLTLVLLLVTLLGACVRPVGKLGAALPVKAPAPPLVKKLTDAEGPAGAPGRSEDCLRIWRDVSTSMSDEELIQALAIPLNVIKSRSDRLLCAEVVRFGRGTIRIWSEQPEHFSLGGAAESEGFTEPDRRNAPLEKKLFRKPWEDQVAQARATYEDNARRQQDERQRRIDREFERMLAYITEPATDPAPCTRFADLSVRVADEGLPRNIIITDGWDDCHRDAGIATSAAGQGETSGSGVLIILLPRKNDSGSETDMFNRRAERMRQFFPGAKVIPAYLSRKAIEALLQ